MRNKIYRLVDANINRASEGIRVLEDLARFCFDDRVISKRLKEIRHEIRKRANDMVPNFLEQRDSVNDVGLAISGELNIDDKSNLTEIVCANFKRAQEALRTIEENLKAIDRYELSKAYENIRFQVYAVEKDYFSLISGEEKKEKLKTDLYCITAQEYSNGRSNMEVVTEMIRADVKIIQYREKDKSLKEKYNECKAIRELTRKAGVTFIVNDDLDLALMVGADGVHIGQDDLPIEKVRELSGDRFIIGVSTHSPDQAIDAQKRGADYIGVGPIYKTYTKKDVCEPVGLGYLDFVVKNIDIPYVAIGGIKEHNLHEVLSHGARCVAMVTEIVGAEDIAGKIKKIKDRISEGVV